VRLPRAQKVQEQSRDSGATYDCQTKEMSQLSFEECIPIVAEKTSSRMKFVWGVDLDQVYDEAKENTSEEAHGT